jgi:hypothetical protein
VIGPLLALSWRTELNGRYSGPAVGVAATLLLLLGLGSHAAVLASWRMAPIAVVIALGLAALAAMTAAVASLVRSRATPTALWRNRLRTEAAGVFVVGLAALLAGAGAWWPWPAAHGWPALVALGAALATSARAGAQPIVGRDVALGLGGALATAFSATDVGPAIVGAAVVASGAVVGHGLLGLPTLPARSVDGTAPVRVAGGPPPASVFAMAPVLDHDGLRRALRPRVLARTSARRLIDAAVDRAWRASATARGRPPIDIVGEDVDVDGDAGELAEALCTVLDHALQRRGPGPDPRITITLRTAPATVGVELDGVALADGPAPFPGGDGADSGDLALARARVLIERHGGQLHVRHSGRGAVHVTLPRRVQQRGPHGVA